jgi:hypothetical protein
MVSFFGAGLFFSGLYLDKPLPTVKAKKLKGGGFNGTFKRTI